MAKEIRWVKEKTGGKYAFPVQDVILQKHQTYLNNPLVKARDVELTLNEEQAFELYRCSQDIEYFFAKYLRIISIDDGIVPFILYDYQKEMLDLFKNNRFSIACTSRQLGKTAVVAGFILWYSIFHESKEIGILANKGAQSQEIMSRIRLMFENLPFFLQPGCITYNKTSLEFDNHSKIFSAATSSSSIRGRSLALCYLDEAAFVQNDFEFYESTYPVITSGTDSRVIMTSTPKGKRGIFYKIYTDATNGANEYKHIHVPWNRHPKRNEDWKKQTIANTSLSQFSQEFEASFLGSAGTLIPPNVLERFVFFNSLNDNESDTFAIYENYIPGRRYVGVVDPSEGLGLDYSVISIFDVTTIPYKVVAVYRNNEISPLLLPHQIILLGEMYGNCPILVEANNACGGQVSYILYYDLEYENTILTSTDMKGQGVKAGGAKRTLPGIKTTKKVKSIGCSNLKTLLENDKLQINDYHMIEELGTFVAKGTSFEADEGANDDTVMTLVLFSWLVRQDFFKDYAENDIQSSLYEANREKMMADVLPVGYMPNTEEVTPIEVQNGMKVTHGNALEDWMTD